MRNCLIVITGIFLIGCGNNDFQIDDYIPKTKDQSWSYSSFPLQVKIPNEYTNEEYDTIVVAADKWNNALGIIAFQISRSGDGNKSFNEPFDSLQDSEMGLYFQDMWFDNSPSTLAITVTKYDTRYINGGDIHFNTQEFAFSVYPDRSGIDFESVVLHELGHFLGLGHSENRDSVMYPSISQIERKVVLSEEDITQIRIRYGLD